MAQYTKGIPPNTGDYFEVVLSNQTTVIISFCPEQGWIDAEWNTYSESDMIQYREHYK